MCVLEPNSGVFENVPIPVERATPRAVEVDKQGRWWIVFGGGRVWIGTGAGDVAFMYDLPTKRFSTFHLPATGVLMRHISVDARTGDVWLAYGASPGIPARVARLRVK